MLSDETAFGRFWLLLGNGILPLLVNLSWILFIFLSYNNSDGNIFFIIAIVLFYLSGMSTMGTYFRATGIWIHEFDGKWWWVTLVCIFYPILYVVLLPQTMISICRIVGVPDFLWDQCCCRSWQTDNLDPQPRKTGRCILLAIPFGLYYLFYVVVAIVVSVFVLVFLFPLTLGPLGCAVHVAVRNELGAGDTLWNSLSYSHDLNTTMFGLTSCLPIAVLCAIYIIVCDLQWFPLFGFIVACIYMLVFTVISFISLIRSSTDRSVAPFKRKGWER